MTNIVLDLVAPLAVILVLLAIAIVFHRQRTQWVVRATTWPYPDGYATYNRRHHIFLDTGLTKQQAQAICDELNER